MKEIAKIALFRLPGSMYPRRRRNFPRLLKAERIVMVIVLIPALFFAYIAEGDETPASLPVSSQAVDAAEATINLSIIGWGIGMATGIALVAAIFSQNVSVHSAHSGENVP